MSDFLDLCRRRQSCRDYADRPVEREKLINCIEAARMAPSGCNSQPWSFVVVDNPQLVPEVAKSTQHFGLNEYFEKASAFIVVLEEHAVLIKRIRAFIDSQYFARHDLGCATMSICLAAEAQGLGTCIIGVFDRERLCELLGLPREQRFACVIAVGYPANDTVRPKVRKSMEEIAKFI
ncbi:MAG: nitroreductase family protein [Deltaproteobacteria bacterium]|nr:nitroreductase family protein [Deltaproteobacteria bacterium]